jgi:hypothetical protein
MGIDKSPRIRAFFRQSTLTRAEAVQIIAAELESVETIIGFVDY